MRTWVDINKQKCLFDQKEIAFVWNGIIKEWFLLCNNPDHAIIQAVKQLK